MKTENENADNAENAGVKITAVPADETTQPKMYAEEVKEDPSFIPERVYQALPNLIKEACDKLDDRERDIFLLSFITVASGIINNVFGEYDGRKTYPNLFFFLIGFPATGKGAMNYSKQAANLIHKKIVSAYSLADAEENKPSKMLFISVNSSIAALIGTLKANNNRGIMFDTEADTLTNSLKQEWGSFSPILRKVFHHEDISDNKNSGNGFVEIENSRLSIAISGTPNQLPSLINQASNGLLSRFTFYCIGERAQWRDVFNKKFSSDYFRTTLAEKVLKFYEFYDTLPEEIEFKLTPDQQKKFNDFFRTQISILTKSLPAEMDGNYFRLGTSIFRYCMVLTCFTAYESGEKLGKEVVCSDKDFQAALDLFPLFCKNLEFALETMTTTNGGIKLTPSEGKLYSGVEKGKEYTAAELNEIGEGLEIPQRTIDDAKKNLIAKRLFERTRHGKYIVK